MGFTKTHKYDIKGIHMLRNKNESELVIQSSLPLEHMSKKKKKKHSSLLNGKNSIIKKVYKRNHKIGKVHKSACVVRNKNNLDVNNSSNTTKENINDENNTTKYIKKPVKELRLEYSKLRSTYRIKKSPGNDINVKIITEKVIDECSNIADKESSTPNECNNTSERKCLSESNIKSRDTENENNTMKSVEQINSSTTTAEYSTIRESSNEEQISGIRKLLRTNDFSTFNCEKIQEHINSMEVDCISDTDFNQSNESCQKNKIGGKTKSKTVINMDESMSTTAEHSRLNRTNSEQESRNELISKNGNVDSTTLNHENTQDKIPIIELDSESETDSNKSYKSTQKARPKTSNIGRGSSSKSKTTPEHYSIRNESNLCHQLLFMKGLELIKASLGITNASTGNSHIITIDLDSNTVLNQTDESVEHEGSETARSRIPINMYDSFPFSFKSLNRKRKLCQKVECSCDKNIQQIDKLIHNTLDNQIQSKILHTLISRETSELPNTFNSPESREDTNETSCGYQNGQSNVQSHVPHRIISSSQLFLNPEYTVISKPQQAVSNRDSVIQSQNTVMMDQYQNNPKYLQSSNLPVGTQYSMNSRQNCNYYPQLRSIISSNSESMHPQVRQVERDPGRLTPRTTSRGYLDKRLRYNIGSIDDTRESREEIQSPRYQALQDLITAINNPSKPGLCNSNQHFRRPESRLKIHNLGQTSRCQSVQNLAADINKSSQPDLGNPNEKFHKFETRRQRQNFVAVINKPSHSHLDIVKQNLCNIKSGSQIQNPGCIQNVGQLSRSPSTQSLETVVNSPPNSIFNITQPMTVWHPTGLNNPKAIPILLIPIPRPVESQGLQK